MLKFVPLCILILGAYCNDQVPKIKTPLGDVAGYYQTSLGGKKFSAFEGIPFAKAPIGSRRFAEPEPIEPWTGTWNASSLIECAQTLMNQQNTTMGREDCLYINVYVPGKNPKSGKNLDVIVHIHGGAYMYGSGHAYSKPNLIMNRNIVYVTFNYRLGVLGFLSTEDNIVPGNNGLKDQTMALKWIQENIASFGGNPESVTITGLSAGGSSVHLHYFSSLSRGLFHKGFSQSGVALNPFSVQENPLRKTKQIAAAVGCPTDNTRILVECLKQRPVKHILDKISIFFTYLFLPCVPFGPVIEKGGSKPFMNADPYALMEKGEVYDVPFIASVTIHEGLFPVTFFMDDLDYIDTNWETLAPSFLEFNDTIDPSKWKSVSKKIKEFYLDKESIKKETMMKLVDIFTDRFFLTGSETAVRMQSKVNKSPVYFYMFAYPGDNNEQKWVSHGGDAKYFFGPTFVPGPLTTDELKMADLLLDMLTLYAKTGTPVFKGVDWRPTEYDQLTYLNVKGVEAGDNTVETTEEFSKRNFWESLQFLEGEKLHLKRDEL